MELHVEYVDGATEDISVGQREMAAFEQKFHISAAAATQQMVATFFRYCAYDNLRRQKKLPLDPIGRPMNWEFWDEHTEEVVPSDTEEDEPDPTPEGQPVTD